MTQYPIVTKKYYLKTGLNETFFFIIAEKQTISCNFILNNIGTNIQKPKKIHIFALFL